MSKKPTNTLIRTWRERGYHDALHLKPPTVPEGLHKDEVSAYWQGHRRGKEEVERRTADAG